VRAASKLLALILPRLGPGLCAGVFSFALSIAFMPATTDPASVLRNPMVVLAACAALWLPFQPRIEHLLGGCLIAWAALTLTWSIAPYDGVDAMIKLFMLAGMFCIGSSLSSLRPVYIGLVIGFGINSAIAIAQWYGWNYIPHTTPPPAGFFVNSNYLGEPAALVVVALAAARLWWWMLPVVPGLLLAECRGAFAGLFIAACGFIWTRSRLLATALVLAAICAAVAYVIHSPTHGGTSFAERLLIWTETYNGLTPLGSGIGSFFARFPSHAPDFNTLVSRPANTHNDFLEMIYELGPGVLLYVALLACALTGPFGPERLVLLAFMTEECFGFPLHFPVTSAFAALCAGRLSAAREPLRIGGTLRRKSIHSWLAHRWRSWREPHGTGQTPLSV
jgi:hypothetical protein